MEFLPSVADTCEFEINNNMIKTSTDISFQVMDTQSVDISALCGYTKIPETTDGPVQNVCISYMNLPASFGVTKAESGIVQTFIASIRTSLDDIPSTKSVLEMSLDDITNAQELAATDQLRSQHTDAWAELWKSKMTIKGRDEVTRAVSASLFAVLSSVRSDWSYGLSPGGLTNYYNGHSFW